MHSSASGPRYKVSVTHVVSVRRTAAAAAAAAAAATTTTTAVSDMYIP